MPENEPNNDPINGWDTWAKHVLKEQKRLSTEVEGCREAVTKQSNDIAELRAALSGYLSRVQELYHDTSAMNEGLTKFKVKVSRELGTLQAKSGVWGAVGALVILLVAWLMTQFGG